jgi:hypothetical protein
MRRLLPLLIVFALGLAACGSDEESDPAPQPSPPSAGIAAGPGISIDEAIAMNSDEPLLVNGNVWADGDKIYFCDAVLESYPPQCAPSSRLEVVGLKLAEVDGLQRASGIAWSERTQLLGVVADGKITVSENAMA